MDRDITEKIRTLRLKHLWSCEHYLSPQGKPKKFKTFVNAEETLFIEKIWKKKK